jgi:hypothetical protein
MGGDERKTSREPEKIDTKRYGAQRGGPKSKSISPHKI